MIDHVRQESETLKSSTEEQELLRAVAVWAVDYAEEALAVFESRHSNDTRPRKAVEAGREFGQGKKRDKNLRIVALAAMKAGKDVDDPSKYAARAATLTASVAYTHTDLQAGLQGIRQARHVLGPVVYAALALEMDAGGDLDVSGGVLQQAAKEAPPEVRSILGQMPSQPKKHGRADTLFFELDSALRG